MTLIYGEERPPGGAEQDRETAIGPGLADLLSFAATPTFAVMALLTAGFGGRPDSVCAAGQNASPLGGMVLMYVLMSAFHAAPWLKRIGRTRIGRL